MTRSRIGLGLFAGIVAAVLVMAATRQNAPGMSLDGVTYMSAADALVHTGELRVPYSRWTDADSTAALSHWAPGLPVLLALPHAVGIPLLAGARAVLILSAFLTVFGLVLLADRIAGIAAAVIAAALVIASPDIARLHTSIWSEPPFLVCLVALLGTMVMRPDKPLWHGLIAALGVLLRYAGIALGAAAALWALARPGSWRARVRGAALAVLPSILVQLWWSWRTVQESASIRTFRVYHFGVVMWLEAAHGIRDWLAPALSLSRGLRSVLAVLVAIGAMVLLVLATRRLRAEGARVRPDAIAPEARLYAAAALIAASYILVIFAARLFADRWIPFDGRIFSPVIVVAELCIAVALGAWWTRAARAPRVAAVTAVAIWCVAGLTSSTAEAREAMNEGRYMTYGYWRYSALLDWVRRDGRHVPIYSNYPSAVFMYAHRSARETPNWDERLRMREFGATLARSGGVFVAFDMPSGWLLPNEPLAHTLALREVARFPDGAVWAASDSTPR